MALVWQIIDDSPSSSNFPATWQFLLFEYSITRVHAIFALLVHMYVAIASQLVFYKMQTNNAYYKTLNLKMEVGITTKSKEISRQLEPVRNTLLCNYSIVHQPITVSSNICSRTNKVFSSTSKGFNSYFGCMVLIYIRIYSSKMSKD